MIISTSGYYSTGSSAIYALLSEYKSCTQGQLTNWQIKGIDYEQVFLYTPDGLFDLEDKLLIGNSIHRSDEAIRRFKEEMKRLYENNYFWVGSFKELLGEEFIQIVNAFVDNICQFQVPGHWEYHYGENTFNLRKCLGSIRRTIFQEKIIGDFAKMPTYRLDPIVFYSFISSEQFYLEAKALVKAFLNLMKGSAKEEHLILNHFLLPHNFHRIPNYFDDDFRVIVVDRDPRDVFVMEKYRTRSDHSLLPCDDVKDFVAFWKALRNCEKKVQDDRVVRIRFEDLIYRYEDTVKVIENACKLSSNDHYKKGEIFSPIKSMANTQLFKLGTQWNNEISYIEKNLQEYLYQFPTGVKPSAIISPDKFGIVY